MGLAHGTSLRVSRDESHRPSRRLGEMEPHFPETQHHQCLCRPPTLQCHRQEGSRHAITVPTQ